MIKSHRGTLSSEGHRANVKIGTGAFFMDVVVYIGIFITVHHCHSPRVELRAENFRQMLNDLVILDML